MGKIIASTYEILQEIGSGGGGVVYLGRHLRLNKKIVLKEYKRTGATKPATVETGAVVYVPLFVETGNKIKIDTRSGEYLSRV